MIKSIFHKYYFDPVAQSIISLKTAISPVDIDEEFKEVLSNKDIHKPTDKKNDNISDGRRYLNLAFRNELYDIKYNLKNQNSKLNYSENALILSTYNLCPSLYDAKTIDHLELLLQKLDVKILYKKESTNIRRLKEIKPSSFKKLEDKDALPNFILSHNTLSFERKQTHNIFGLTKKHEADFIFDVEFLYEKEPLKEANDKFSKFISIWSAS